jgi:hypothetical protein
MWRMIHASQLLFNVFLEYLKVANISMVHVFSYLEYEQYFSFIAFLNNKTWNIFNNHLQLVVSMYARTFFTHHNFPYEDTHEMWYNVQSTNGQG